MSTVEETTVEQETQVGEVLPILPLRGTVVFPDSMTPLAIGQERSVRLVDEAVANDRPIALVATRDEDEDEAKTEDDIYSVGTAAQIHKMIRVPDGTLRILVQGTERVRLQRIVQHDPYLVGEFVELPDVMGQDKEIEALARNVEALFSRIIGLVPYLPDELQLAAANADDPSALANLIATTMRLKASEKQELLEEGDVEARLRRLTVILNRELEVFELGTKIQSQVQSEMEKGQREYFLRQQLKAIQEELGEGDEQQAEMAELRAQIEEANLPEEADRQARRELDRLAKLPPAAAEYGVIRTYLEWILSVPWNTTTEDDLDLEKARQILDEDHYDLEKVKERIVEHLAVSKLKEDLSGPILCFVGPPGVGKTSLGQSIARALGRKFVRISVGGVRDEAEIRGHRRTYIGAMPGTIIRALRDAESKNPVFMIDEIDKMGADWRGDPSSAMLEVLDPAQTCRSISRACSSSAPRINSRRSRRRSSIAWRSSASRATRRTRSSGSPSVTSSPSSSRRTASIRSRSRSATKHFGSSSANTPVRLAFATSTGRSPRSVVRRPVRSRPESASGSAWTTGACAPGWAALATRVKRASVRRTRASRPGSR
jgi:ATP-dependent Lon protease